MVVKSRYQFVSMGPELRFDSLDGIIIEFYPPLSNHPAITWPTPADFSWELTEGTSKLQSRPVICRTNVFQQELGGASRCRAVAISSVLIVMDGGGYRSFLMPHTSLPHPAG